MSIFTKVSGLFTRAKSVDAFIDPENGHIAKIGAFIGKQQHTEEEKAIMFQGLTIAVRQFAIDTAKESTQRSSTRRNIAVMWIKAHLSFICLSFLGFIVDHPRTDKMWLVASSDVMMWGTAAIMIFFFGSYGYGTYVRNKK